MSKRWVTALFLLSGCAPSLAGQLRGSTGEVVTSHDARVNITPLDRATASGPEPEVVVITVDQDGRFATKDKLPQGRYLVEALVPGYAPQSKNIDLAMNPTATIDLTLTPVAKDKVRATSTNSHVDEDRGAGRATLTPPSL